MTETVFAGPQPVAVPVSTIRHATQISHPGSGRILLAVNGETRQTGDLGEMIRPAADIISHVSQAVVIKPGDVIFTGTPAGVEALKPGDKVAGGVDGIAGFYFEIGKALQTARERFHQSVP